MVVVCVLCGVPLRPTTTSASGPATRDDWMHPCLITATPEYLQWQKEDAKANRTTRERQVDDDKLLTVIPTSQLDFDGLAASFRESASPLRFHPVDTTKSPINIPLHNHCLVVARKFCAHQQKFDIDFRAPGGAEPTYLTQLYEIWCNRAIATWPYGLVDRPIKENHKYLGVSRTAALSIWASMNDSTPAKLTPFETSPLATPGLTRKVLQHLRPVPDDSFMPPHIAEVYARMEQLPAELFQKCIDDLEPFENPSLECSRIKPPSWWRDQLRHGQIVPWLWDLNWTETAGGFEVYDSSVLFRPGEQTPGGSVVNSGSHNASIPSSSGNNSISTDGNPTLIDTSVETGEAYDSGTQVFHSVDAELMPETVVGPQRYTLQALRRLTPEGRKVLDSDDSGAKSREAHIASANAIPEYDWELLVRQLAQHDVLEPTGILGNLGDQSLHNALWNRRRIWKLLTMSRLGHINWAIPSLSTHVI